MQIAAEHTHRHHTQSVAGWTAAGPNHIQIANLPGHWVGSAGRTGVNFQHSVHTAQRVHPQDGKELAVGFAAFGTERRVGFAAFGTERRPDKQERQH